MKRNELYHHGVKGQRWGVRRYQNKDGTLTATGRKHLKEPKKYNLKGLSNNGGYLNGKWAYLRKPGRPFSEHPKDFIIEKGAEFSRMTNNPDEVFKDRLYVSMSAGEYMNDFFMGMDKLATYTNDRDVVVAGKETTRDILKSIGSKTLPKKNVMPNLKVHINPDFMFTDSADRKAFIAEAKKRGYDAIMDPVDSSISGSTAFSPTAMIFFDDVLRKTAVYDEYGFGDKIR